MQYFIDTVNVCAGVHADIPIPPEPPPTLTPWHDIDTNNKQILSWVTQIDTTKYTSPVTLANLSKKRFKLQANGGANRSVTNIRDTFTSYWDIDPYYMGGIVDDIKCTGKGIFPLLCSYGSTIMIQMYYSPAASCTVISPTDMVVNDKTTITGGKSQM